MNSLSRSLLLSFLCLQLSLADITITVRDVSDGVEFAVKGSVSTTGLVMQGAQKSEPLQIHGLGSRTENAFFSLGSSTSVTNFIDPEIVSIESASVFGCGLIGGNLNGGKQYDTSAGVITNQAEQYLFFGAFQNQLSISISNGGTYDYVVKVAGTTIQDMLEFPCEECSIRWKNTAASDSQSINLIYDPPLACNPVNPSTTCGFDILCWVDFIILSLLDLLLGIS